MNVKYPGMANRGYVSIRYLAGAATAAATACWLLRREARSGRLQPRVRRGAPARTGGSEQRPGDILLFRHARGENLIITWFTGSPFYHAAISEGDGCVLEARPHGVVRGDLAGRETNFVVLPAPQSAGEQALAWARRQVGKPYDMLDVAIIILDRIIRPFRLRYTPPGRYTCGEFVAAAFAAAGVRLVPDREIDDVLPADIARLLPRELQR